MGYGSCAGFADGKRAEFLARQRSTCTATRCTASCASACARARQRDVWSGSFGSAARSAFTVSSWQGKTVKRSMSGTPERARSRAVMPSLAARRGFGVVREENLHDMGVAVAGGHHQRRRAVRIGAVRIGAGVEQRRDRARLGFVDRVEQRRPGVHGRVASDSDWRRGW